MESQEVRKYEQALRKVKLTKMQSVYQCKKFKLSEAVFERLDPEIVRMRAAIVNAGVEGLAAGEVC